MYPGIKSTGIMISDPELVISGKYSAYIDNSAENAPDNLTYYYNIFLNNLFDIIHSKLRERNDRIRILTKKTIREKLLAYFEYEYLKTRSKFIYMQSNFAKLADYLAINRSAMFRELKSLKEDYIVCTKYE